MGFGTPKPPPVDMPPPAAHPATMAKDTVQIAGQLAKQKAASAEGAGMNNTVFTSMQGVSTPANTATATLLGQ